MPKTLINSKDGLIKYLNKTGTTKVKKRKPSFENQEYVIGRRTLTDCVLTNDFTGIEMKNCKFVNCTFENIWGFFFLLEKCKFINCEFKNSRFSHLELCWDELYFEKCNFRNVQWDEGALFNIYFEQCSFYGFSMLGMVPAQYVVFNKCAIRNAQFQSIIYYKDSSLINKDIEDLIFDECTIEFSYFNSVDLRNSYFIDTTIYKSGFINCELKSDNIKLAKVNPSPNYAAIDFQTILSSDKIDKNILGEYFNIQEPNIKTIIQNLTSKMSFKSVFISYSFKDKEFANRLNKELNKNEIKTFLWEKDAPGGHTLKDIMAQNIQKHDRILFIASANSLKSSACQFELTEGRKKQEATWETVFFPIHIDDFLFTITKEKIRPITKSDEYWDNIEELKRINSTDFKKFNVEKPNSKALSAAVKNIIKELKL